MFRNLKRKHIKWVKNLLYDELPMLLRQEILLSGRHITGVIYTLITGQYFGTKLF